MYIDISEMKKEMYRKKNTVKIKVSEKVIYLNRSLMQREKFFFNYIIINNIIY